MQDEEGFGVQVMFFGRIETFAYVLGDVVVEGIDGFQPITSSMM